MQTILKFLKENQPKQFWGSVGAGVLPICRSTGRALIAYRSGYVQEPNTWGVWGGKLDLENGDETVDDVEIAARREFREEANYSGQLQLIPSFVFRSRGGNFVYHNFVGIVNEEFEPELDWETEDYRWLTWDELTKLKRKHFGLDELLRNDSETIKRYMR